MKTRRQPGLPPFLALWGAGTLWGAFYGGLLAMFVLFSYSGGIDVTPRPKVIIATIGTSTIVALYGALVGSIIGTIAGIIAGLLLSLLLKFGGPPKVAAFATIGVTMVLLAYVCLWSWGGFAQSDWRQSLAVPAIAAFPLARSVWRIATPEPEGRQASE